MPSSPSTSQPTWKPYGPHMTKPEYDRAFNEARRWLLEEAPHEEPHIAARIYHVKEDSLRQSIYRSKKRQRNAQGVYNTHGGNNKVLDTA
jgi:hypothetical protein